MGSVVAASPDALLQDAPPPLKKPRRNPALACQLCRTKKIKCDRNRPCANCVTRKVDCVSQDGEGPYAPSYGTPRPRGRNFDAYEDRPWQFGPCPAGPSVTGPAYGPGMSGPSPSGPSSRMSMLSMVASREAETQERESTRTALMYEEVVMGMRKPTEAADGDGSLEAARPAHETSEGPSANRASPTENMNLFSTADAIALLYPGSRTRPTLDHLVASLPEEHHAFAVLENYFVSVHCLYHLLHKPTVEQYFRELYGQGIGGWPPDRQAARLSLLYAVLAIGAHFWCTTPDPATGLTAKKLACLSSKWRTLALDGLTLGKFLSSPSLDSMQSLLLLPLVLFNAGEAETFRNLSGAVVKMAYTIGLHNLGSEPKPGEDRITFELKRRMWWFICASDWLESSHGGMRMATYMINKKLMTTSLPSNCFDEDLTADGCVVRPLSTPTPMTYFFKRIELAHICYDTVELMGLSAYANDTSQSDYDALLSIDRRYRDFIKNLPPYYRVEAKYRAETEAAVKAQPYIGWHRSMIHLGVHSMLMRLHRPFLIRGSQEPRLAYSRMSCLRSAHTVLKSMQKVLDDGFVQSIRLWVGIHHLFIAAVVLSIDLNCNEDEPHAEETRKEIVQACRLLEMASNESTIAQQGLRMLRAIVRRWKQAANPELAHSTATTTTAAATEGLENRLGAAAVPAVEERGESVGASTAAAAAAPENAGAETMMGGDGGGGGGGGAPDTPGSIPLMSDLADFSMVTNLDTPAVDWSSLLADLDMGGTDQWWASVTPDGGGLVG